LKLGGVYAGILNKNEQFMDIELAGNIFCEIVPADGKRLPVSFIIDEKLLSSPPENLEVYNLKTCYKISVKDFYSPSNKLKVEYQVKVGKYDTLITLFQENNNRIMLENKFGFYYEDVPSEFKITNCYHKEFAGENLIIVEGFAYDKIVLVFSEKKLKLLFKNIYDTYEFEDMVLKLEFNFSDIAKHRGKSIWLFDGEFKMKEYSVTDTFSADKLNEKLIPYCFFEEILCGGNSEKYLSSELKPRVKDLKGFLGLFIDVIAPPFNIEDDYVGLIYRESDNMYKAKYFKAQLENRLITNIIPLDS
jgi:hypothetical protein